ncbi:MAG: hypothetical protein E6G56_08485 [Actinobacteria bacterium]|nr:MAG: hypothetical protein E6G56_08485 [Actinomycetota bacterium]
MQMKRAKGQTAPNRRNPPVGLARAHTRARICKASASAARVAVVLALAVVANGLWLIGSAGASGAPPGTVRAGAPHAGDGARSASAARGVRRRRSCRPARRKGRRRACRHKAPRRPPTSRPKPAPSPPPPTAAVGVHEHEYSITLTRGAVSSGRVLMELVNEGEDAHNLQIAPAGVDRPLASFDALGSGQRASQTLSLAPGSYRLWCSLPGHDAAGMHTYLTVG